MKPKKRKHKVYTHYLYKKDKTLHAKIDGILQGIETKKLRAIVQQRVESEYRLLPDIKERNSLIINSARLYTDTSFGKFGRFKRVKQIKGTITFTEKKGIRVKDRVTGKEKIKVIRIKKEKPAKTWLWYDRKTKKYYKGEAWVKKARQAYEKNIIQNIAKDKKISTKQARRYYDRNRKKRYIQLKNIYYNPY